MPKADTERTAPPYTRFDWGIDWKGFDQRKADAADDETKTRCFVVQGKVFKKLRLFSSSCEAAGAVSKTLGCGCGIPNDGLEGGSVVKGVDEFKECAGWGFDG